MDNGDKESKFQMYSRKRTSEFPLSPDFFPINSTDDGKSEVSSARNPMLNTYDYVPDSRFAMSVPNSNMPGLLHSAANSDTEPAVKQLAGVTVSQQSRTDQFTKPNTK